MKFSMELHTAQQAAANASYAIGNTAFYAAHMPPGDALKQAEHARTYLSQALNALTLFIAKGNTP